MQHLQMSDQNIFLTASLLRGVALRIDSCGRFALLAGRSFNSGIRISFFQGMRSKRCCRIPFSYHFSQSTCLGSPVCDLFLSLFTWAASLLSWHPLAPRVGLKAVSSLTDSSGTCSLVVLKISLSADPENQVGKSVKV